MPGRIWPRRLQAACVLSGITCIGGTAWAQSPAPDAGLRLGDVVAALIRLRYHEVFGASVIIGLVIFAVTTSILHIRSRSMWQLRDRDAQAQNNALTTRAERAEFLLHTEPQIVIVWSDADSEPDIAGTLPGIPMTGDVRSVTEGGWLSPEDARRLKAGIAALRMRGEGLQLILHGRGDTYVEVDGRAVGGRAVLRLRNVTGDRKDLALLEERHKAMAAEMQSIRTLLDEAGLPLWLRGADGRLAVVNGAYAKAVDADADVEAIQHGIELLDRPDREQADRAIGKGQVFRKRVAAVVKGARRSLDVVSVACATGSASIAIDATEVETLRSDIGRQIAAHARTLDQLATAVAIYDADQRLTFHNSAFADLWQLAPAWLDERPSDSEVLERLRTQRRLPEQPDFRAWRQKLHEAYRALEADEQWWHLPGGRTLRVVTTPNPAGGVTYLYEDVSERIALEARYKALSQVQGETLENLKEGVAVFGSDGRLRLHNTGLASIWKLSPAQLDKHPHIDEVIAVCSLMFRDHQTWATLKSTVTSFGDDRRANDFRMSRVDGSVVDVSTVPLPDGGTLMTFTDVTDTVNFENALVEKNEALEDAARVKNEFVHHVSYELRSPLTNIIGFVQLLADGAAGPLSQKQRQYAGYIMTSSDALLAIINNILDLATIDAGAMQLDLGPVDAAEAMHAIVEAVQPRLAESGVRLDLKVPSGIGTFEADGKRVRQVLFNLLSNAIGFSEAASSVTLTAERTGSEMVFRVEDHGRGIPQDVIDRVFERFESHVGGTAHRGVGLGLSLVRSFVELHGGTVELVSEEGRGTLVTCRFPLPDRSDSEAAE